MSEIWQSLSCLRNIRPSVNCEGVATVCKTADDLALSWVLTNQLCGAEYHSRGPQLCSHSVVSQHFMEPEGALPHSQELSTCTYPEPDQSSPQHSILSLKGLSLSYVNVILSTLNQIPRLNDTSTLIFPTSFAYWFMPSHHFSFPG
jgi:hypothetical protein